MFADFDLLRRSQFCIRWVRIFIPFSASWLLLITACAPAAQSNQETEFQSVLSIRTDPQLRLVTQYEGTADSPIVFVVNNHTDKTIFFQDDSLGLRAYKYNASKKTWTPVPVEPEILHPNQQVTVPPKDPYSFPFGAFEPWWFTERGKLRLVVVGWTDPANPKGSQIAAYSDVEIK